MLILSLLCKYECDVLMQALILRDVFLLTVISIGFELLEYTLEPQLANFGECWWDHVSRSKLRTEGRVCY